VIIYLSIKPGPRDCVGSRTIFSRLLVAVLVATALLVLVPRPASAIDCRPDNPQETYTIRVYGSNGLVNIQGFGNKGNGQTVTMVGGCTYAIQATSIAPGWGFVQWLASDIGPSSFGNQFSASTTFYSWYAATGNLVMVLTQAPTDWIGYVSQQSNEYSVTGRVNVPTWFSYLGNAQHQNEIWFSEALGGPLGCPVFQAGVDALTLSNNVTSFRTFYFYRDSGCLQYGPVYDYTLQTIHPGDAIEIYLDTSGANVLYRVTDITQNKQVSVSPAYAGFRAQTVAWIDQLPGNPHSTLAFFPQHNWYNLVSSNGVQTTPLFGGSWKVQEIDGLGFYVLPGAWYSGSSGYEFKCCIKS